MKISKDPYTALFPCPVVLVTCLDSSGKPNIITLAWAGTVCSNPPTVALGINPKRYSYVLIEASGEFVVNIPTRAILKETDFCGVTSGRDVDKFFATGLTADPAEKVTPPLIRECPVNLECRVRQKILLGSHCLFLGEVVLVHVNEDLLQKNGRINFAKAAPIVYNQREYWSLRGKVGTHGFSKQFYSLTDK
ncbi:MAG: flavin reductase family protein [Candidatus Bathyarchaeota archaeon]